jgi:hypothetical protein
MHHTTIIDWVREAETQLPEDEEADPIKVAELDELQTFLAAKSRKFEFEQRSITINPEF